MTGKTTLEEVLTQESYAFAELLGTLHALRFTGGITLHFLNGQPQTAELGKPLKVVFPEHPANKNAAKPQKSVDSVPTPASSSSP